MKKSLIFPALLVMMPATLMAQTALSAFSLSQGDLRGTARYMSMGGAFTALGGDITSLNQNPAGIGVYRSSDISATLDITMHNARSGGQSAKHTSVNCNNFGYVGTAYLGAGSAMPFFNWGFSYSRVASFDRRYHGSLGNIGSSLTNYIADYTQADGYMPNELTAFQTGYNPYLDSQAPWMSILAFNTYGINSATPGQADYKGLWDYDTSTGTAEYEIEEKGHIDEYSINFGGNIQDVVYWGIGIGIDDIDFKQTAYYGEKIENAIVPSADARSTASGTASYGINNWRHIYGSGFNFKFGLIVKPVNEFRIGIAIHTPTYYNLTYEGVGAVGYNYTSPTYPTGTAITSDNNSVISDRTNYTDYGYLDSFDWKLRSPWRMMIGAAGVIGGKAIVSAEYEYRPYPSMKVKDGDGYDYTDINSDIKTYYQNVNILRLGAEYRLSNSFSIRGGYSYESSPVTASTMDGNEPIYTSGTDDTLTQPAFSLDRSTQYVTCGIGWHYKNFYADAAYVHRYRRSKYQAYTSYQENIPDAVTGQTYWVTAPSTLVTQNDNSIVLTIGIRF